MEDKIYRSIDVWRRKNSNCAIRYRCFEIIGEGKFYVQSADCHYFPTDHNQTKNHDNQFLELFLETSPDKRTEGYPTIKEAIEMHENEFENF